MGQGLALGFEGTCVGVSTGLDLTLDLSPDSDSDSAAELVPLAPAPTV